MPSDSSTAITETQSRILQVNIISTKEMIHRPIINPGWLALFEWDGTRLQTLQP